MGSGALFEREGEVLHPTLLCRGPWADQGFLHGSAVCAAAGWALERAVADPTLALARFTVEIRSMVPLGPLVTAAWVVKPGRRSMVVEATLHQQDRLVVRATSQWVTHRPNDLAGPAGLGGASAAGVMARPAQAVDPGANPDMDYPRPGFNCDAVELRPVRGTTEDEGPGLIWVRLAHPVVAGEVTSSSLMAMTLADFGIAVGWQRSASGAGFINPDVTLQLNRPPRGPWILMASRVHASAAGYGFCETVLGDDTGLFGRILQSLVEAPVEMGVPGQV